MKEFIAVSRTTKEISSNIKQQYALTYEELFILVHVHEKRLPAYNVKDIITVSKFKPYYITKALQKLKENGYLSKREMNKMNVLLLLKFLRNSMQRLINYLKTSNLNFKSIPSLMFTQH